MHYSEVVEGSFVHRINRFVAEVEIDGRRELVHVKNTGRLKELLVPGARAYFEVSGNEGRKYRHSLIAVEKDGKLINIDSQAPNAVVHEAMVTGKVRELGYIHTVEREATWGNSRFDLLYEGDGRTGYMEVKGVTLLQDGIAMFPDAPTARGRKHVQQLVEAVRDGYEGVILFLVQTQGARIFAPHAMMDPPFAEALREAAAAGVRVLAYDSVVSRSSIEFGEPIDVEL
jgi:sugar fermentation stimulation protein A